MNRQDIYTQVGERYGSAAKSSNATYSTHIARAFGYSNEDLESVPKDANLGLSCGTPLAIASLKEVGPVVTVLQE
jgi:arsenite methyltransferase